VTASDWWSVAGGGRMSGEGCGWEPEEVPVKASRRTVRGRLSADSRLVG
jgi:hypothetical protein